MAVDRAGQVWQNIVKGFDADGHFNVLDEHLSFVDTILSSHEMRFPGATEVTTTYMYHRVMRVRADGTYAFTEEYDSFYHDAETRDIGARNPTLKRIA